MWAQDKKRLYLTINVESKDPEIKYTENSLYFKGVGAPANKIYEVTINFLKNIVPDKAVSKNITRCIEFSIPKSEENESFWSSLTTDKVKPAWLKVDFNKWKDEDDDDGFGDDFEGDFGGMGGMSGMGGMGNMDDMLKNLSNKNRSTAGLGGGDDSKPAFDESDEEDSDDDIPPIE